MSEHNLLAILVGSIAGFGFGALWYSPVAFLNPWMPEAGITPDVHLKNPGKVFGGSFVFTLVAAVALAYLLGPQPELPKAVLVGALTGLCLVGGSMGANYLFVNRSITFWMIDASFHVFRLATVGLGSVCGTKSGRHTIGRFADRAR